MSRKKRHPQLATQTDAADKKTAVRMEDVARRVGVSSITVSRVLRSPDKVADATRRRVCEAIDELGYVPNELAGSLASRKGRVVGALVPTITNSIFADTIHGLADGLSPSGFQLLLATTGYSLTKESQLLAAMLSQRPAALFVTGLEHERQTSALIRASHIPAVESWTVDGTPIDMAVGFSNRRASHDMVCALARGGARCIAYVGAPVKANDRAANRLAGYLEAVRELGLDQDARLWMEAKFSFRAGAESLATLLSDRPDVDAVFCANDILAIGAMFEAQRRGLRIPDDLAIAGFDDVELASQVIPTLSTVRIPRYEIGREAARMILVRIGGGTPTAPIVDLGFDFVERESAHLAMA